MMPLYKKILVPTDGSKNAQSAAVLGLEMAKMMNAEVTVISIVDVKATVSLQQGLGVPDQYAYQQGAADAAAEAVMKVAGDMTVKATAVVKRGSPAFDIIEASKDHDLVIMATKGLTGVKHFLMGSVAEKVVRFAECPVLVIKTLEHED
ncbi:MAG: universal stress protein [Methanomassiliicoccus sp.]|nr:universal stress protein [Methanomassiliicoccus sp.]